MARAPRKVRRLAPKRTAKHKRGKARKTVIGKDAGTIITGKSPGITKVGACIRQSRFSEPAVSTSDRIWIGANNIANEKFALDLMVEGMIEHIFRRAGDLRANKDAVPLFQSGIRKLDFGFTRRVEGGLPAATELTKRVTYVVNATSSSFNGFVYNNIAGVADADANVLFIDAVAEPVVGGVRPNLQRAIFMMAKEGYYINTLDVFRLAPLNDVYIEIFHDAMFGKLKLKMDIAGRHRFQNVTPASNATGSMNGMNAMSIDANPLTGKIFTFGHLSPRMTPSWLAGVQDDTLRKDIEDFVGRPQIYTPDITTGTTKPSCTYEELCSLKRDWPLTMKQFDAAPLRPRTMWSNVKTTGPVHFPPGGFKTFKTRFTYSGSVTRFCQQLIQQDCTTAGSYPSLGGSFLMCLRPTMKTTGEEQCTMAYDFEKIGKIQCSKFSHGTMATTNDIEG